MDYSKLPTRTTVVESTGRKFDVHVHDDTDLQVKQILRKIRVNATGEEKN